MRENHTQFEGYIRESIVLLATICPVVLMFFLELKLMGVDEIQETSGLHSVCHAPCGLTRKISGNFPLLSKALEERRMCVHAYIQ